MVSSFSSSFIARDFVAHNRKKPGKREIAVVGRVTCVGKKMPGMQGGGGSGVWTNSCLGSFVEHLLSLWLCEPVEAREGGSVCVHTQESIIHLRLAKSGSSSNEHFMHICSTRHSSSRAYNWVFLVLVFQQQIWYF